jgi:hypothetical protein
MFRVMTLLKKGDKSAIAARIQMLGWRMRIPCKRVACSAERAPTRLRMKATEL